MEKVTKPRYAKTGDEAIFQQLRQDVSILVQQLQLKRRGSIILKAVLFPALYLFVYLAVLGTVTSQLSFMLVIFCWVFYSS